MYMVFLVYKRLGRSLEGGFFKYLRLGMYNNKIFFVLYLCLFVFLLYMYVKCFVFNELLENVKRKKKYKLKIFNEFRYGRKYVKF